ncbi:MAG TPA: YicC family protein [Bacteroidales bacterium]|nr:YicC family protein [Bacteroidales bacterium]
MTRSMTGYGKAECLISEDKYLIEIRSLNGKNADITLKTQIIPREKEISVRQYLIQRLNRGNIDLYVSVEQNGENAARSINGQVLLGYYNQLCSILDDSPMADLDREDLLPALLKMPDIVESKVTEFTEEEWEELFNAICRAADDLDAFRLREGAVLREDVLSKVSRIEEYLDEIGQFEQERVETIRQRLLSRIEEISLQPDQERLEQELIFYMEKLDINEEKVRLRQHCNHFRGTLEHEEYPGRKLGFIAQEMGREINTIGSKANHAGIQRIVVMMKDELEKIKEQSLNIL